jgi:hypothetical protein
MKLTPDLHLTMRMRKTGAKTLTPFYVYMSHTEQPYIFIFSVVALATNFGFFTESIIRLHLCKLYYGKPYAMSFQSKMVMTCHTLKQFLYIMLFSPAVLILCLLCWVINYLKLCEVHK